MAKNFIKIKPIEEKTHKFMMVKEMSCTAKLKAGKKLEFGFSDDDMKKWKKATYEEPYIIGNAGRLMALFKDHNGHLKFNYFISYVGMANEDDVKVPAKKKEGL